MSVSNSPSTQPYQTKTQRALTRLRNAIISGELRPGQKIPQDQIARELNISLTPLREALQTLKAQGFISIIPHHGAVVNRQSAEEIKEIYLILLRLEMLAARVAVEHIDEDQLKTLRRILDDAHVALGTRDHERVAVLNQEFHHAAYEPSGCQILCRLIFDLRNKCERYRHLQTNPIANAAMAIREQERILEAWQNRDPDEAENAIRINVANNAKALLATIGSETDAEWLQKTLAYLLLPTDIS